MEGRIFRLSQLSEATSLQTRYNSMLSGNASYNPSSFDSIATANGTGSSGTITFSSIPSTYTHLQVRFMALTSVSPVDVMMKINSTVTGLYDHYVMGYGTGVNATNDTPAANGLYLTPQGVKSTNPTVGVIDFLDYTNTNKYKTVRNLDGRDENGAGFVALNSYLFNTTSAISSITFTTASGNFTTDTKFALYGIKGA